MGSERFDTTEAEVRRLLAWLTECQVMIVRRGTGAGARRTPSSRKPRGHHPGAKAHGRIDNAVRTALQDRSDLQDFFAEITEPGRRFFVKNLERVQGDERDAIILTVGVAKRANGTVARTGFGPLNSENGRRRMNVAVTRAKRRMTVISSFGPHELPPATTGPAPNCSAAISSSPTTRRRSTTSAGNSRPNSTGSNRISTTPWPSGLSTCIRRGGTPNYHIDFALAHRNEPGRMVLAVEADGATCHSSYSVRDRDRLRQTHLENLGWRFHRVWSSAWFADRHGETDRIVKAWEQAMIDADREPGPTVEHTRAVSGTSDVTVTRGPRPPVPTGLKTHEYTDEHLIALCRC